MKFVLKEAEKVRVAQTEKMLKQIKSFYADILKEVRRDLKRYGNKDINRVQLLLIQRDIKRALNDVNMQLESGITQAMKTTSRVVTQETSTYLKWLGFRIPNNVNVFSYVPETVVQNILTGQIYQDGWSLSKAIWGHTKDFNDKLSKIIAEGAQRGKSAYEIAKDLEKYVNPNMAKDSRYIKFKQYKKDKNGFLLRDKKGKPIIDEDIPEDKFYFGKTDYNAQRLARTMISHAYQQSFEAVNKNNPFVTGYQWVASGIHGRMCNICAERDGQIFEKDDLPLDHPNGMCTFVAVIPYESEQVADMLNDWYDSPVGTYPDLDLFAQDFMWD